MLIRYKKGADGLDAVAHVYSKDENHIDRSRVDSHAIAVVKKLAASGFESYLVGGAVRDLMLGRTPKDFDVATAASPRQVHKLFYNSRIIGRRFKLVHIIFGKEIIEVSTFRSTADHDFSNDNQYGTIEEDSTRRDFSINSLYYDPLSGNLIDFNNAMADFKARKLVSLLPLNKTFNEDPVRMVRAIKYSVTTGFRIPFRLSRALRHYAPNLAGVSTSRMTEEVNKILACGCSSMIIRRLNDYKMLVYILPALSVYADFPELFESLDKLDAIVNQARERSEITVTKAQMYLAMVQPFISVKPEMTDPTEIFADILRQIKVLISPITPPNYELESCTALYMKTFGVRLPKGAVKHRNPDYSQAPRSIRGGGKAPAKAEDGEVKPSSSKRKRHRRRKHPTGQVVQDQA